MYLIEQKAMQPSLCLDNMVWYEYKAWIKMADGGYLRDSESGKTKKQKRLMPDVWSTQMSPNVSNDIAFYVTIAGKHPLLFMYGFEGKKKKNSSIISLVLPENLPATCLLVYMDVYAQLCVVSMCWCASMCLLVSACLASYVPVNKACLICPWFFSFSLLPSILWASSTPDFGVRTT